MVSVAPASLSFTASGRGLELVDWNLPKTVSVHAPLDADAADSTATISHVVTSSDGAYNGVSTDVAVTVEDGDRAHAVSICDRTEQVRQAILAEVNDTETSCGNITTVQLAGISTLDLSSEGIETLQAGDFSGLSSLTSLHLARNSLTSLPSEVFSGLSSLISLSLGYNSLTNLSPGVFSDLSSLTWLYLHRNRLTSLPSEVFSGLSSLEWLYLHSNSLTSLPPGVFSDLSSLTNLNLSNNPLIRAGITITPPALTLPEGSSSHTYAVVLNAPPASSATVGITSSDTTAVSVAPASLSFTASGSGLELVDWNLPKTVSVHAPLDADAADSTATISHVVTSSDGAYNGVSADVAVAVEDADAAAGVLFEGVEVLETSEEGGTALLGLSLSSQPRADVTITPASNDISEGSVSGELIFTPANWDVVQWVTVTGVDDDEADGHQDYQVSVSVSSAFTAYDGLAVDAVSILNRDNDPLPLSMSAIAEDDVINAEEGANVVLISGTTGSIQDVGVRVMLGEEEYSTSSGVDGSWSVALPAEVSVPDGASLEVTANASKDGYVSALQQSRTVRVDLQAPPVPHYNILSPLKVGVAIEPMSPEGVDGSDSDVEYTAPDLPSGLEIAAATGTISGEPVAVQPAATSVVRVTDSAGNSSEVTIAFPAIEKGDQDISDFAYSPASIRLGEPAPTLIPPRNVKTTLSYVAAPDSVCSVDGVTGELTIGGEGRCTIIASASANANYNAATAVFEVEVLEAIANRLPSAPQALMAIAGDGQVRLTWEAPANDGGATITNYQVRYGQGGAIAADTTWWSAGVDLAEEVTGLRNNEEYSFEVRAVNSAGGGEVAGTRATPMASTALCERTDAVERAILLAIGGATGCEDVTHEQLGRIISLDLGDEGIEHLQSADFAFLSSLRTIRLDNNELENIPAGLFSGLSSLTSLYLEHNRLSSIPSGLFSGLSSLTSLYLEHNRLSSIPSGLFSGLSSLTRIYLEHNRLSSIPAELFSGLSSLTRLYLDNNRLNSIPAELFSGLSSLTRLYLDNNRLSSIPAELFSGLSSLTILNLGYNRLSSIPAGVFSDLSGLRSLNLDNNRLHAGVSLSTTSLILEEATMGSYTMVLNAPPRRSITVSPSSGDATIATLAPASLQFTASGTGLQLVDWNLPKTVTIYAAPVHVPTGRGTVISHSVSSADTAYDTIAVTDVSVSVTDVARPTVLVHGTDNLSTSEAGGTTSFQLSLSNQPTAPVQITSASNDTGEGTVAPSTLTFLPTDWSVNQSVTVTGVDDLQADGNQAYQITFTVSSDDARYNGVAVEVVSVTNRDDESASPNLPTISVDDAHAQENAVGAVMAFTVRLSQAAASTVTVSYATRDGSAKAGQDYTTTEGELSFAPGQEQRTISVPLLQDVIDEGSETFSLLLADASAASILDGVATGIISNSDPLPRAWLARFGRSVAQQVMDAVDSRLTRPPRPGVNWRLAGYEPEEGELLDGQRLAAWLQQADSLTRDDLVEGTSFAVTPEGGLALWGGGAVTSFAAEDDLLSSDGEVFTALLAGDWSGETWTAGAALAHSRGDGTYDSAQGDGEVGSSLSGIYPYGRYRAHRRLALWGMAGYGRGELRLTPEGEEELSSDLRLSLAAVGIHALLLDGGGEGINISSKADALLLQTTWDGAEGLAADVADVSRLRWGLQADRAFPLSSGASLHPTVEVALRSDGGDADAGVGADLAAALLWDAPGQGITAEVKGQMLLTHGAEGFQEQGLSASLAWRPGHQAGEGGPSLRLGHSMGGLDSGGMERLLSPTSLDAVDIHPGRGESRFEARFASAPLPVGSRWSLRPEVGFSQSSILREYSLGATLSPLQPGEHHGWEVTVERRQQEHNESSPTASQSLDLHFSLQF